MFPAKIIHFISLHQLLQKYQKKTAIKKAQISWANYILLYIFYKTINVFKNV